MAKTTWFFFVWLLALMVGCGEDDAVNAVPNDDAGTVTDDAAAVNDAEAGAPIDGGTTARIDGLVVAATSLGLDAVPFARVAARGGPAVEADATGHFSLEVPAGATVLDVRGPSSAHNIAASFSHGQLTVTLAAGTASTVTAHLLYACRGLVDTTTGGTFKSDACAGGGPVELTFPADGLVKKNGGAPFAGVARVEVAVPRADDPHFVAAIPELGAGYHVAGALSVDLTDATTGEELELMSGKPVVVKLEAAPAVEGQTSLPVRSFNEAAGKWVDETYVATVTQEGPRFFTSFSAAHFSITVVVLRGDSGYTCIQVPNPSVREAWPCADTPLGDGGVKPADAFCGKGGACRDGACDEVRCQTVADCPAGMFVACEQGTCRLRANDLLVDVYWRQRGTSLAGATIGANLYDVDCVGVPTNSDVEVRARWNWNHRLSFPMFDGRAAAVTPPGPSTFVSCQSVIDGQATCTTTAPLALGGAGEGCVTGTFSHATCGLNCSLPVNGPVSVYAVHGTAKELAGRFEIPAGCGGKFCAPVPVPRGGSSDRDFELRDVNGYVVSVTGNAGFNPSATCVEKTANQCAAPDNETGCIRLAANAVAVCPPSSTCTQPAIAASFLGNCPANPCATRTDGRTAQATFDATQSVGIDPQQRVVYNWRVFSVADNSELENADDARPTHTVCVEPNAAYDVVLSIIQDRSIYYGQTSSRVTATVPTSCPTTCNNGSPIVFDGNTATAPAQSGGDACGKSHGFTVNGHSVTAAISDWTLDRPASFSDADARCYLINQSSAGSPHFYMAGGQIEIDVTGCIFTYGLVNFGSTPTAGTYRIALYDGNQLLAETTTQSSLTAPSPANRMVLQMKYNGFEFGYGVSSVVVY